jgi:membrane protein DedA with SNARE-associated domain
MFSRFPGTSLMLGKFVPGISTFVVPVAGFSGMAYPRFVWADGGGIILWATLFIGIGYLCGDWILSLKNDLEAAKWLILAAAMMLLIGYYGFKLWRLRRFGLAEVAEAR